MVSCLDRFVELDSFAKFELKKTYRNAIKCKAHIHKIFGFNTAPFRSLHFYQSSADLSAWKFPHCQVSCL